MAGVPAEDNYVDALGQGIGQYFVRIGLHVRHETIPRTREGGDEGVGFDKIFFLPGKIFALQVKRPYPLKSCIRWNLRQDQHAKLARRKWVFYALADVAERRYLPETLHHTRFVSARFPYCPSIRSDEGRLYYRWGSFAKRVLDCRFGKHIETESELDDLVPYVRDLVVEYNGIVFSLNPEATKVIVIMKPSPE